MRTQKPQETKTRKLKACKGYGRPASVCPYGIVAKAMNAASHVKTGYLNESKGVSHSKLEFERRISQDATSGLSVS